MGRTGLPSLWAASALLTSLLCVVCRSNATYQRHNSRSRQRWRGNKYVSRDGILPYQRCGVNSTSLGPRPLHAAYSAANKTYDLVVLAASVWGNAHDGSVPPNLDTVEFLAFDLLRGQPCDLDKGRHCMTAMNAEHAQHVGQVECKFVLGSSSSTTVGLIRPPTMDGFNAFVIACPFPSRPHSAGSVPDEWIVTLSMGGATIPVDICYDHVDRPLEVVACTEPAYGYNRSSKFWGGEPRFAANHTMVDAFLTYHTKMMDTHVRFNDLDDGFFDAVKTYTLDGHVSYRSGWKLDSMPCSNADTPSSRSLALEVLAYGTCHWEFRYRARWAIVLHAVDNFVAPMQDISLAQALRRASVDNISSMHVPIAEGFSQDNSLAVGANILLRYPVLGPDNSFGNTRHTPIIDPRHVETVWVHWAYELRPTNDQPRIRLGPEEALHALQLHTLHIMAMTRPERDIAGLRRADPLTLKRGMTLQAYLDGGVSGHL